MLKTSVIIIMGLTFLVMVLVLKNLSDRIGKEPLPDDGVTWVDTNRGIIAEAVRSGSTADRAGIVRGDFLRFVSFDDGNNYYEIKQSRDIFFLLDEKIGLHGNATYTIERIRANGATSLWDADLTNIDPEPTNLPLELYLSFVGLVFLIIGLYVFTKQTDTHHAFHFYLICLTVFTIYSLNATGEYSLFDRLVYFVDGAALLFLAPLFFHFCLIFPFRREFLQKHRWVTTLLYAPAIIMLALRAVQMLFSGYYQNLLTWELALKRAEVIHFSSAFLLSTAILLFTFMQTQASMLRQQLKWIVWGLALNAIPFTIFYAYPYAFGQEITHLQAALAIGTSILLPISFGYSIVRYRLMDVDIIVRRSMTYGLATMSVVVIFMLGVVKAGEWVRELVPSASQGATLLLQVAVMSIAAMLFSPIKNWLEERVDRLFFGERYDYRRGLADFGRTLSSTTELSELLDALSHRLGEMLSINRLAIFIESESAISGFDLAYSNGMPSEPTLPDNFSSLLQNIQPGRGYLPAEQFETGENDPQRRMLYYYVPCYVRDRMVAVIGLGKTIDGAMLTSEDIELVRGLSVYVAVAIENSLLYLSEQEKSAALVRLKDFSENIIESINIGLAAVDPVGTITNWNSALEELLSISRDKAVNYDINEIFEADLINTIQAAIGNSGWQVSEVHNVYRYKINSRDGRELVVNISISPLVTKDSQLAGTLLLIEDITARVRLEEQLRETDKLSSIGLLAAGVAHEVNTPLTGISSYTQMLLAQTPTTDSKFTILEKIKRQTLRASEIVNNLLNFSRTGNVEFGELDINKVLEDTIQLLEPQFRNTQISLERAYGEDLPSTIGNPSKLQQVFMNLLINARDAMPQGGQLTILTQYREGSIMIEVADTGIGIAADNIAKIYDPFFTTKGVGQGTGLGLAVSYGIIQEHKGRIFVESKPGEGTCFHIKLPAVAPRVLQAVASD